MTTRPLHRPRVMGIVNVTPDSFSDGGRHDTVQAAIAYGLALVEQGADILDIGGESTRPGATPVDVDTEIARTAPVIAGLRDAGWSGAISIDTMKPPVACAAVAAGANIWNDVTALSFAPDSVATAVALQCDVVLMHMQGQPQTMQHAPHYDDVVTQVADWLAARAGEVMAAGVAPDRIWLDPGIGFGKTAAHNLTLTRHLNRLTATGLPILYGASRKRTIQSVDPTATEAADRLGGSLALALEAARRGAAVIRVHDVRVTVQALKVQAALSVA